MLLPQIYNFKIVEKDIAQIALKITKSFMKMSNILCLLNVNINDTAGRGIKLTEDYNSILTKYGHQKQ